MSATWDANKLEDTTTHHPQRCRIEDEVTSVGHGATMSLGRFPSIEYPRCSFSDSDDTSMHAGRENGDIDGH